MNPAKQIDKQRRVYTRGQFGTGETESGFAELDCVFTTNFPDDVKETWIVDTYELNRLIQFVRFSDSRIIRYCIELVYNNNYTTNATWTQTVYSLNSDGNLFIDNLSAVEYENEIKTRPKEKRR